MSFWAYCFKKSQIGVVIIQNPPNGYHDSTFHPFTEEVTSWLVDAHDGAGGVVGVGGASAGAVEPCPAVPAGFPGVDVAAHEFILDGGVLDAVEDVAQQVLLVADELVAGIQVAPGGDGHVLGAAAAAGNALVDAGAALQVDHVVVEGEGLALLATR